MSHAVNIAIVGANNMIKLIKNVEIYSPTYLGKKDILILNNKIEKIDENITLAADYIDIIDGSKYIAVPGYIDQHVHVTGGGGEQSFKTRVPEIGLSEFIKAGITTVIGLLGTDSQTRSVENLISKTKALNEEGMTAYMLTGAYEYPSPTITGSVKKDITFFNEIIGVKLAISDHRASYVDRKELEYLASEARVGGMLGGKSGIVTLHVGNGNDKIKLINEVVENSNIPIKHFVPTHINRNRELLEEGFIFAANGGNIDLTVGSGSNSSLEPSEVIKEAITRGIPTNKITISSDGNGSWSNYDDDGNLINIGVSSVKSLHTQIKKLITQKELEIGEAVKYVTSNVANMLKLNNNKGYIKEGFDADILLLDNEYNIDTVLMNGKIMMQYKTVIINGTFE